MLKSSKRKLKIPTVAPPSFNYTPGRSDGDFIFTRAVVAPALPRVLIINIPAPRPSHVRFERNGSSWIRGRHCGVRFGNRSE